MIVVPILRPGSVPDGTRLIESIRDQDPEGRSVVVAIGDLGEDGRAILDSIADTVVERGEWEFSRRHPIDSDSSFLRDLVFARHVLKGRASPDDLLMLLWPAAFVQKPLRLVASCANQDRLLVSGAWLRSDSESASSAIVAGRVPVFEDVVGEIELVLPAATREVQERMGEQIRIADPDVFCDVSSETAHTIHFDCIHKEYRTASDVTPAVISFSEDSFGTVTRRSSIDLRVEPTSPPEFVYLSPDSHALAEDWIRRTEATRVIILTTPEQRGRADALRGRSSKVEDILVLTAATETGDADPWLATLLAGVTSIVLPLATPNRGLEFVPDVTIPDLAECFPRFRGLWRTGFRVFNLYDGRQSQRLEIPVLLDQLVGAHEGQRCFVVGNGPSLNRIDMRRLASETTIGSNRCYLGYERWGYAFSYWGIMDRLQVEEYRRDYEQHVPSQTIKLFPFEYLPWLRLKNACPVNFNYDWRAPYRFGSTPDELFLGFSVTHMLLQVAVLMGCNPIYLVGVDHRYQLSREPKKLHRGTSLWTVDDSAGPTHFAAEYAGGSRKFVRPRPERAEACFDVAAAWTREHGIEILNATPDSALRSFRMVEFDSLF